MFNRQGGERMGRPRFSPPPKKQRLHVYSWQGKVVCVFPQTINHMHNSFSPPDNLLNKVVFNLLRVGKEWAGPVFPHPLISNLMFYAYSGQGNSSLAGFFPTPLTICTTVLPNMMTLCIRLMFKLVRMGKEWAGPVFCHPLKATLGFMHILGRVGLALFFCRWLTICTTVFTNPITFWIRLMFNLVRVGKEWAGPVFPHPLTNNFVLCVFWTG